MHPFTQVHPASKQVAVHWFEQSSFAIKNSTGNVLQIDPYFPHQRPAEKFIHAQPPLDESQLPTDGVLLTHAHGDHTCTESIQRIWQNFPQVRFVGPQESIDQILRETEIPAAQTEVIQAGESTTLGTFVIHAVYAKPPQGDPDANIQPPDVTHLGYVLESNGVRLYFSGDPINTFADHAELIQPVAALSPQLGFLTNHPTEGEFPFFEGSAQMARRIGLQHAVPVHRACFVKRDYDPSAWAEHFSGDGPQPMIMQRDSHIVYP